MRRRCPSLWLGRLELKLSDDSRVPEELLCVQRVDVDARAKPAVGHEHQAHAGEGSAEGDGLEDLCEEGPVRVSRNLLADSFIAYKVLTGARWRVTSPSAQTSDGWQLAMTT